MEIEQHLIIIIKYLYLIIGLSPGGEWSVSS